MRPLPAEHAQRVADFFGPQAQSFRSSYEQARDFRARFALWSTLIAKYRDQLGAEVCFDLGCGPGVLAFYTASLGLRVTGVDLSAEMIAACNAEKARLNLPQVNFVQAALPLPATFPQAEADLILCSSVLEYLEDLEGAVRSMAVRLRPGGVLLASLPNRASCWRRWERWKHRLHPGDSYLRFVRQSLTVSEAERLFRRCGLTPLEHHFYGDGPLLSRATALLLPDRFSKNLFVMAVAK